jgi:hypothetical protein
MQHEPAEERADHVHVAVGEVQELEDPVHHRVAKRDERVEAAERQPADRQVEEQAPVHGGKCVTDDYGPSEDGP